MPKPQADKAARRKELETTLQTALGMTEARLTRVPNYIVYQTIYDQLQTIHKELNAGQRPSPDTIRQKNFSAIAARELEFNDIEFTNILNRLEFLYRQFPWR